MKNKLPINNEVLKWARTSINLSLEDVARRVHKKIDEIISWEKGESSPTFAQLERLSHQIYKRPVAIFFFPEVPDEDNPKTEFRTLPFTIVEKFPPEIIKLYRKAKLFQLYLDELFEGNKPKIRTLLDKFSLNESSNISSITLAIREEFGISIQDQSKWKSTNLAFKKWRKALEDTGIFIFKDAFRNDDYSGFCIYDQMYPIIFANNSMPSSRQIFTLFHELGHLLFQLGGVDFRNGIALDNFSSFNQFIEINCNRFANEFLVPSRELDSFSLNTSESFITRLSQYFSVSREVILRNYLDRGLIDRIYYEEMASKWADQARKHREEQSGSGNYYYNQRAYLGENYVNLVYKKYYQKQISVDSAAEYLNMRVKSFHNFENIVLKGGIA